MNFKSINLIESERKRQIIKLGYTSSHDDSESEQQLSLVASIYACPREIRDNLDFEFPWDPVYYNPDTTGTIDGRIGELTKAGALISAEIDRLIRLKKSYNGTTKI